MSRQSRIVAAESTGGVMCSRDELPGILEQLDAKDMNGEATRLGTATTSLLVRFSGRR